MRRKYKHGPELRKFWREQKRKYRARKRAKKQAKESQDESLNKKEKV